MWCCFKKPHSRLCSVLEFIGQFKKPPSRELLSPSPSLKKVLRVFPSPPRTQGPRENSRLLLSWKHLFPNTGHLPAVLKAHTYLFIQPALCAGDCLWIPFFFQRLFRAEWKITQDENRASPAKNGSCSFLLQDEYFVSLSLSYSKATCHLSLVCPSLTGAIFLVEVYRIIVCSNHRFGHACGHMHPCVRDIQF